MGTGQGLEAESASKDGSGSPAGQRGGEGGEAGVGRAGAAAWEGGRRATGSWMVSGRVTAHLPQGLGLREVYAPGTQGPG